MKLLFHLHTNNSFDSFLKPGFIVDYAVRNGITSLAITDHDTIQGSLDAANYVQLNKLNINIIIGAEYYSSCGDIIGIFLNGEIRETNADKLIDEIHRQGGIAILPHPFKSHTLTPEILHKIDVIETFNPRCSPEQNYKASELAKQYKKPTIIGNDAHLGNELSLCYNILEEMALKEAILSKKDGRSDHTSKIYVLQSQLIKGYKRKDIILIVKTIKSLLSTLIFQPVYRFLKIKNMH